MKQLFLHKSKHILYNTWTVDNTDGEAEAPTAVEIIPNPGKKDKKHRKKRRPKATPPLDKKPPATPPETDAPVADDLTPEQMSVVLGSMSDNRITDSVKDLVAQATE